MKDKTLKIILLAAILFMILLILTTETILKHKKFKVPEENGEIRIFFCPEENCERILIETITNSSEALCAFYEIDKRLLDNQNLTEKLSFLIDEDNYEGKGTKIKSKGLMHNKFCIIDKHKIITGSFNPGQNKTNNDNLLIIESKTLSENYLNEYNELKQGKNDKTIKTEIKYNGYTLKNYFCPEDNCQEKIIRELKKANSSIQFLTFTFTDKEIAQTIISKKKEGIEVKGVMEKFQNHNISTFNMLKSEEVKVKMDSNPKLQHNKVFIIDNRTVITGSFNPTKAANTVNDENILIIENPEVLQRYSEYFQKIFNQDP